VSRGAGAAGNVQPLSNVRVDGVQDAVYALSRPPVKETGLPYRVRAIIAGVVLLLMSTAAAGQAVSVVHEAPLCLPDRCRAPRLLARVTSPERVDSVVVWFRAEGEGDEYYTLMRPSSANPDLYWGYLPIPLAGETDFVEYVIEATDASGAKLRSEVYRVDVSESCQVDELTDEEKRIAQNLVVGLTRAGQVQIPPGFRCAGIVSTLTASGDLMPNEDCRRQRAEHGDDSACPVLWLKPTVIAVGAAGTGAILIESPKDPVRDLVPLSPARP
jgi:hypothetical protein